MYKLRDKILPLFVLYETVSVCIIHFLISTAVSKLLILSKMSLVSLLGIFALFIFLFVVSNVDSLTLLGFT